MSEKNIVNLVDTLCRASSNKYVDFGAINVWPETLEGQWCMSPELLSVWGTETYERLNLEERKRLSFYEAVNFFCLNIHGEKPLVKGLVERLYTYDDEDVSKYLHYFLDEENKHLAYFGTFCRKYAGKIYDDKKIEFPQDRDTLETDFLFFVKVQIFEEIVDVYNTRMAADERLAPIARAINKAHHIDETRHLAFGRRYSEILFSRWSAGVSSERKQAMRDYLAKYLLVTWKEYYRSEVYEDAGLVSGVGPATDLANELFLAESQISLRREVSENCVRNLMLAGILDRQPEME